MSTFNDQPTASGLPVIHLSELLRAPLVSRSGEDVGRVEDVIVRLRADDYPPVTGIVADVGGRRVFVSNKPSTNTRPAESH